MTVHEKIDICGAFTGGASVTDIATMRCLNRRTVENVIREGLLQLAHLKVNPPVIEDAKDS